MPDWPLYTKIAASQAAVESIVQDGFQAPERIDFLAMHGPMQLGELLPPLQELAAVSEQTGSVCVALIDVCHDDGSASAWCQTWPSGRT